MSIVFQVIFSGLKQGVIHLGFDSYRLELQRPARILLVVFSRVGLGQIKEVIAADGPRHLCLILDAGMRRWINPVVH